MQLLMVSAKPLFQQIADGIEADILTGVYAEGTKIPSIRELAAVCGVNTATVQRSIKVLFDAGILVKTRGKGIYVSENALEMLRNKRYQRFYDTYIIGMMAEATRLCLSKEDVVKLIDKSFEMKTDS